MKPTVVISHVRDGEIGMLREVIGEVGSPIVEVNLFGDDELPRIEDVAAIVSLGGKMSSTNLQQYPFLAAEVELLRDALTREVPTLGICLGAQLLALAAGGRVATMPREYIGWPLLSRTGAAGSDPHFDGLPDEVRVLKWHEDGIDPPSGATILATTTSPGAALFRVGAAAWGSQMHIELTTPMLLERWLSDPHEVAEIESVGHRIAEFRETCARLIPAQEAALRPALESFARLAADGSAG